MTRQFTIKLDACDTQNFLSSSRFEHLIAEGWLLKDRIPMGSGTMFVFQTENDALPMRSQSYSYAPLPAKPLKPVMPRLRLPHPLTSES